MTKPATPPGETDDRALPGGRIGRFARMATVGMRTGASLLLSRDGASAAKHAAEVFGTLRGLAAKVGQMASYVDGVVPEAHRDAYETAMKSLRAASPTSTSADIRALVEQDLGGSIETLFATWDERPIASASIGQVHHATLHDGTEVAVKVQHTGIARAIESDLSNAGILESVVGVAGGRRFDSRGMLEVIRTRFREELDYTLEASRQRAFAAVHEGDARVVIPRVIDDRCGPHVLTTTFVRGASFDDAIAASETQRRAWATTLWHFVFKGNLVAGMFNADPHPGNYLFQDEGRIAFLDFGCVQPVPAHRIPIARALHRAALDHDDAGFRAAAAALTDAKPGPLEELTYKFVRLCFEPLFASPYRITRSYAGGLVGAMHDMGMAARSMRDEHVFSMPPEMLFMNRLNFGFYSVLARLDVEVDYAEIERAFV